MQRAHVLMVMMILLVFSGFALAQTTTTSNAEATEEATPQIAFVIEGEIGRALPRKIVYDPQHERMAVVDAYSRLLLVNALDYSTIAVLHERGEYGDIAFSHDGRWLAAGYNNTMELWDAETQTLAASLPELGNVRYLLGPMAFSSNDEILVFYGVYPAPRALRISETDSITYPWVWHLPAARKEKPSTFPNEHEAVQMVDYANGFVLSPDDKFVAALPSRLRVIDAFTLEPEYEIPTARYEQDPLSIWNSLADNTVYVRPVTVNTMMQVDTKRGVLVEIPMNTNLTTNDLALVGGLEVGSTGQVIGGAASRKSIPLLQVFLGSNYRDSRFYGNRPLTVTLIDLLAPPATAQDNVSALIFVFDEQAGTGQFQLSRSGAVQQMVLSPDQQELLVRLYEADEYVITYDLQSGNEVRRFLPAQRGIGAYSRAAKNRVLAYDLSGGVIISDFQRLEAATNRVLAEDLRYSRQFDRFFFSQDSQKIITLGGTEWREWSIETGEVLRRDVVSLSGSIIATSPDGYRYLALNTGFVDGGGSAEVVDMNTGERYSVPFAGIPGSSIAQIYANPSWTRFLVIYSENPYGPYYPGNQIAMYHYLDGLKWMIAGDDLPPVGQRRYGWVDEDTVFIYGQGTSDNQPPRVYDVEYAPNGLPACIVNTYADHVDGFLHLWERLVYNLRADQLDQLSLVICDDLPGSAAEVERLLLPTETLQFIAPTGVPIGDTPQCLTARFPGDAEAYADVWQTMTEGMSSEDQLKLAAMLCEGIGEVVPTGEFDPSLGITMFIDAESGERSSGDYQPPVVEQTPLQPIYELFEKTENRPLGTAILSPNRELVAASTLPGELVIYRMVVSYATLMQQLTATVSYQLEQANLIKALPSPSPTYNPIGSPRPTLTPTPKQTLYPRPAVAAYSAQTIDYCPSEQLYTLQNLPASYDPSGRIYAQITGDYLWIVEPEDGTRREAQEIPQCQRALTCEFSPDNAWILAQTYDFIYIVRPDNSDPRILWDLRTPYPETPVPYDLYWSGDHTLEWSAPIPVTVDGNYYIQDAYIRDVLNVFPDPKPWIPEVTINELPASFVSRQPGGEWAVVSTSYNTGLGEGYKYYLYHTGTGAYQMFAQNEFSPINIYWHPLGDRLFFVFSSNPYNAYQVTFPDLNSQYLEREPGGVWSNDGRYLVYSSASRAQPVAVLDSQTGETRTYCLPETGARLYAGSFTWSPDNRYVALQAPLPKDEARAGVGSHTLILNLETGEVVDLTTGVAQIVAWSQEPGTYGSGVVVTPTATASLTPTLTATVSP